MRSRAGTTGQAVSKEIFNCNPKALHIVDISENNMVELVRELPSAVGYGLRFKDIFCRLRFY